MNAISLTEKNWIWFFYCKYYMIQKLAVQKKEDVPPPRNLCHFWWIAVFGFVSWVMEEAKILYIWLVAALSALLVFTLFTSLPPDLGISQYFLTIPALFVLIFSFAFSVMVPMTKMYSFIEKKAPWILYIFGGVWMTAVLVVGVIDGETRRAFFMSFVIIFGAMFSLMAIVCILYFTLRYLADRPMFDWFFYGDREWGTFMTLIALLRAQYRRVCPLINPPEGFEK